MATATQILPLLPAIQQYAWGIKGDSYVKRFSLNGVAARDSSLDQNGPMAEAWAACHPNGMSKVRVNSKEVELQKFIEENPIETLGKNAGELMVLGKILSVGQPLSIQNHPNSEAAKILHAQFPHSYDPNPKPEASIALTEVELLYGFRPETEILNYMRTVEPFGQFFEAGQIDELVGLEQNGLRSEFLELACTLVLEGENKAQNNETKAKALCKELYATLETKTRESLSAEERWILELSQQYPKGDVGCFFFYLLNLVTLEPGTCQYIATGTPHAYLKGEMLEFMYSSDNTLRAGLTPKDKDIETLLKITDFASTTSGITAAEPADNGSLRFSFPAEANFAVSVMKGPNTYECKADSIGILISPDATGSINDETRITPYGMWLAPAALATYQVSLESGSLYLLQSA